MSVSKQNSSFNISATSSHLDNYEDIQTVNVRNYIKDLLKSRIFLGRYLERRLIDQRIGYRDVVLVSPAEVELKRDLQEAQHKLQTIYPSIHWIGISDSEAVGHKSGVCLWTEIDNQPFGPFWFQIKTIKFRDTEIIVILKCVRHITDSFLEIEPILTGSIEKPINKSDGKQTTIESAISETYGDIAKNFQSALSIKNAKEFLTFLFAFVIAIFTGSTAFINFVGNFILALVREMSILIKNSTPMFLGFLDFLSKIVGGFYILIAMFFKPNSQNPLNKRSVAYYERTPQNYDPRHFD
ncbi:uncharacterized protein LOC113400868 [Vanessa tameamea]|uniref:Uncharacterized protein LOC113400868 n=1 Tax=Vanessa tameamea TaxID=334116 RepID=A0A8B8IIY6_VANTA|nr:uncharacterized protein LOC113400868 [Vanessa tameamea]